MIRTGNQPEESYSWVSERFGSLNPHSNPSERSEFKEDPRERARNTTENTINRKDVA